MYHTVIQFIIKHFSDKINRFWKVNPIYYRSIREFCLKSEMASGIFINDILFNLTIYYCFFQKVRFNLFFFVEIVVFYGNTCYNMLLHIFHALFKGEIMKKQIVSGLLAASLFAASFSGTAFAATVDHPELIFGDADPGPSAR